MDAPRQNTGSGSSETWWAFLTIVPFINWLAFLYVGLRANYSAWKIWALIYALPWVLWILLPDLTDDLVLPLFALYFVSIYHGFHVRGDYKRRMAARRGIVATPVMAPVWQPPIPTPVQPVDPIHEVIPTQPLKPVDLNNASEEAISGIPGVGSVLAKKAVSERHKRGGFKSVEDFGQVLGLMPHVVERLRPMVVISAQPVQTENETNQGRVVDV